jgi:hypothetical protein
MQSKKKNEDIWKRSFNNVMKAYKKQDKMLKVKNLETKSNIQDVI